jgi:hypothetical protein
VAWDRCSPAAPQQKRGSFASASHPSPPWAHPRHHAAPPPSRAAACSPPPSLTAPKLHRAELERLRQRGRAPPHRAQIALPPWPRALDLSCRAQDPPPLVRSRSDLQPSTADHGAPRGLNHGALDGARWASARERYSAQQPPPVSVRAVPLSSWTESCCLRLPDLVGGGNSSWDRSGGVGAVTTQKLKHVFKNLNNIIMSIIQASRSITCI